MKVLHRIVSIIALFCFLSPGFSKDSKKRFLGDGSDLDILFKKDCIRCFCSQNCPAGDLIKGACQVFTNTTDCSHDQCHHDTCSGHGHCYAVHNAGQTCTCNDGYIGKHCDQKQPAVTTPVDFCAKTPCQHGQCSSTPSGYLCTCNAGWQGTNCETSTTPLFTPAPDLCANHPCGAHGQCRSDASGYHCACVTGWRGQNCEIDIDQCNSSPCKNNGTCLDLGSFVTCACADGWSGTRCEKDATPSCNHVCVIEPFATGHSVFNESALKCNDVHRGSNEAIPMTCCGIGQENTWYQGMQVIAHCSGTSALPSYTPIASFKSGRPVEDTSGVLLRCEANGFQYIRQTCDATPHIIAVNGSNGMEPSSFYVIY